MVEHMYCQGCGAQIQTSDTTEPGYVPTSALNRDDILCRRCFRLKHYNETQEVSMTDDDFLEMVSSISQTQGLIVYIVDVFDLNGSMIFNLPRIIGNHPIILVGNKVDLLPQSTNRRKLDHWLRASAHEAGITVEDVFLISSTKGHGIEELTEAIVRYRHNKDVYIVGVTNVGKSTFINRLIKQSTGHEHVITTSYFPGTTLGFIKIPLDDGSYIIDTPGIVNQRQMAHYVSDTDLKKITPKKEIKAKVYQLHSGQTLFFGGLARLDYMKGDKQSFVCYFSRDLPIHRTKTENANDLYDKQRGKLLLPPNKETLKNLPSLVEITYRIDEGQTDIVFPGLGWVTITNGDATVAAHSPKDVSASVRKSFV